MSDEAIGVAVLHLPVGREEYDWAHGYLYFVARHGDGRTYVCDIPIVAEERYDRVKAVVKHALWAYRIAGDVLHCHPSVNDQGHAWHNAYDWSVRFVMYDEASMGNAVHDAVRRLSEAA